MSKPGSMRKPKANAFTGADGKEYRILPLSINGMIAIQERYELESIEDIFELGKLQLQKPKNLRFLIWVVLQEAHPDLEEEEAGSLINIANLGDARNAVVSSFSAAVPEAGDETEAGKGPEDPTEDQEES